MSLRIKHPLLLRALDEADLPTLLENQVQVLEHLGKPKALLVIVLSPAIREANVGYSGEARCRPCGGIDRQEGVPGPCPVRLIASGDEGVVVGFYHLGAEVVVGCCGVEAIAGVKVGLRCGHVFRVPGPALWADG